MKKIAVIGSINCDYFIEVDVSPKAGETQLGTNFFKGLGGKGANQAVAASRLGAAVTFFGSVGNDDNGIYVKKELNQEKVDTSFLNTTNSPTGVAFVEISNAENRIVVVPGANSVTNASYVREFLKEILEHDIIIFQLEIPMETIEYLVPILHKENKIIIVNPAPALYMHKDIINKITYLTPNEHEYEIVLRESMDMENVLIKYPNKLVVTCGKNGVKFFNGENVVHIPAYPVKAVDTTGAGDTYCGAFAAALAENKSLIDCIKYGNLAAALSVLKKGAQKGMPHRKEVDQFFTKELYHEGKRQNSTN